MSRVDEMALELEAEGVELGGLWDNFENWWGGDDGGEGYGPVDLDYDDDEPAEDLPVAGPPGPFGDTPPGFVAPGAVPPRPEKWDLDHQPFAHLTLTYGDTLVGLAKTYLGAGGRWTEIWNTGGNRSKIPDPDVIMTTGPLDMPEEARANMVNWLNKGQPPGSLPGNTPPETTIETARRKWPLIAGGAAVGLGVLYFATR